MTGVDISLMITGDGIRQAGFLFSRTCARGGLHTFSMFNYPSLIRGGHNFHLVRVCDREVHSHRRPIDFLLALNQEAVKRHAQHLSQDAALIYDPDYVKEIPEVRSDLLQLPIPLGSMAREVGAPLITRNSAGLGAIFSLLKYDLDLFLSVIEDQFKARREVAEMNKTLVKKILFRQGGSKKQIQA